MKLKKFLKIKIKRIKVKLYLVLIFLILILLSIFIISNFMAVLSLQKQVNSLLSSDSIILTRKEQANIATYSNTFSEPFFNKYFIDESRTTMFFDDKVTALTFKPLYELNYKQDCLNSDCDLEKQESIKVKTPSELANKDIKSVTYNKLEKKWLVSYIITADKQEQVYVYLLDGKKMIPLITDSSSQKIKTQYGRGNGFISAGGSDNQFIILYSGYEALAFLYNEGNWQDLSAYLGLRVSAGGFKSKVIRSEQGTLATWYICADDGVSGRLIKLWQNNTDTIQGSIDLSSILGGKVATCFYNQDGGLKVVSEGRLSIFKDLGFDNQTNYYYTSNNINSYPDRKVAKIYFLTVTLNAAKNSYAIFTSADKESWDRVIGKEILFDNKDLNTAYLKVEFKTGDNKYSPWFNGLENIFYVAYTD